jgi:transposase-like protein
VALEALRRELTTAQLAIKHGIHQTMVGEWKRQAMELTHCAGSGWAAVYVRPPRPIPGRKFNPAPRAD